MCTLHQLNELITCVCVCAVTSIDGIQITQEINLQPGEARVDQKVSFSDSLYLRLSASASTTPQENAKRIDFTFDLAYFQLGPLRIPYPVSILRVSVPACMRA